MAGRHTKISVPLALGVGILIGLLLGLVFKVLGPFPSVLAGIGGFIAGLIIFRRRKKEEDDSIEGVSGITREMHRAALRDGYEKIAKLRAGMIRIENRDVRQKAEHICELAGKILESVKNDPKDLKPARHFLNYYMDTTTQIVASYAELGGKKAGSRDVEEVLAKTERMLSSLEGAYEKQLEALLENDVMDLDTELTVLEKTLQMEGFTDIKHPKGEKDE